MLILDSAASCPVNSFHSELVSVLMQDSDGPLPWGP